MLTVGDKFPEFAVKATINNDIHTAFVDVNEETYADKWRVFFFWPKDFTFVCPTEIAEFGRQNAAFEQRNAKVLGGSTDSEFVHLAWRKDHPELTDLPFPMLADVKRELSQQLGIIDKEAGVCQRATFIVDPDNTIRFASVTDLSVGRNVKEVLRVLDALQTDQLTPCGWSKGDDTLKID